MSALVRREAAKIREEWLGSALSALPADHAAAEAAISGLYHLIGLGPPRFHWVSSPLMAQATVPPGVRPGRSESAERESARLLPSRFGTQVNRLTIELDRHLRQVHPLMERLIRREVRGPLSRSWNDTLLMALREANAPHWPHLAVLPQDVAWIAHYDALRRTVGVVFTPEQTRHLDLWATVVRSCGWWWPRPEVCVVSERHVEAHTEVCGEGEVRLHNADGPALRYADGWDLHAWHGTRVPSWVITDPAVDRIAREANVEVRRCAIEHLGWPDYVERAGLRLVAAAPDPGNPGSELRLYDMRRRTRVLLAVNGSAERDGHRRRYGLTVPGAIDDPVAAAGWTYGLSGEQYSLLQRRT